jgi:hypothetical protein
LGGRKIGSFPRSGPGGERRAEIAVKDFEDFAAHDGLQLVMSSR